MNSERLKQIEEIYHAALEISLDEREDFFNETCGEDFELRRKVESLLSFDEVFDEFIDTPPASLITEAFSELEIENSLINKKIGHYNIQKLIGKGGMGEVYLAEDIKLNRKVALKFLSASVGVSRNRLRRFEREALAASALNHPNILTIYEFGEENETPFLATEFVDGKTLREILSQNYFKLKEILNIAEQTAFALSAAHKAGIIHRDIKPENIMLRDDGIIKVLDFGLAKLITTELSGQAVNLDSESILGFKPLSLANTNSSGVMGTIAYMSPEQVRGSANIDGRTDIWSLGVVLYEMLTGKTPFGDEKSDEVVAAILKGEFLPINNYLPDTLPDLEKLVGKLLCVDPKDRYQNINELLSDLRNLRDEWNLQSKLEQSQSPQITDEDVLKNTNKFAVQQTGDSDEKTSTTNNLSANSSTEYFVESINQHKYRSVAILIILSFLLIGGFVYLKYFSNYFQTKDFKALSEPIKQTRLTNLGRIFESVISPDGKFLAYTYRDGTKSAVFVREMATNITTEILPMVEAMQKEMAFSPDSSYLYYLRVDKTSDGNELHRIKLMGGKPEKLISDVDTLVTFLPNRQEITYRRDNPQIEDTSFFITNFDGTNERKLASRQSPNGFFGIPNWFSDGNSFVTTLRDENKQVSLIKFNVNDSTIEPIGQKKWDLVYGMGFINESNQIFIEAQEKKSDPFQIWRVAYPGGEAVNITNDFNQYHGLSITADGKSLVTVKILQNFNLFVAPVDDLNNFRQVTSFDGVTFDGFSWTPDGKIVYGSNAGGKQDIWIMNGDGSQPRQLTNDDFYNHNPVGTYDGKYIFYESLRSGKNNIWRMNADGSNPVQITNSNEDITPTVSPDNQSIVYASDSKLWKVSIDGGEPSKLIDAFSYAPQISPNGKSIALRYWDGAGWQYTGIAPITGGTQFHPLITPPFEFWRWTADSRHLIYVDSTLGFSNLFELPVDNGKPKQLTNFKNEKITAFEVSRDGKQVVFLRGTTSSDSVMINNFR